MNIDGKALAQELRDNLKTEVKQLQDDRGITPGLTVVLVGEDPASQIYVRNKVRQTEEVGMISNEIRISAETSMKRTRGQTTSRTTTGNTKVSAYMPGQLLP